MAGKLLKLLVKHKKTGKMYMRYFKTQKGFNAAKGTGKAVTAAGKHKMVSGEAFAHMTKGELKRELRRSKRMLIDANKKVTDAFLRKEPATVITKLRGETHTLGARVKSLNEASFKKALQRKPAPARGPRPKKKKKFVSVPKPNIRRSLR